MKDGATNVLDMTRARFMQMNAEKAKARTGQENRRITARVKAGKKD